MWRQNALDPYHLVSTMKVLMDLGSMQISHGNHSTFGKAILDTGHQLMTHVGLTWQIN